MRLPKLRFTLLQLLLLAPLVAILILAADALAHHDDAHVNVLATAIAPDQRTLATVVWPNPAVVRPNPADARGRIQLWDLPTGKPMGALVGHTNRISAIAFAGDTLVSASWVKGPQPAELFLWDVVGRRVRAILKGHTGSVHSLAVSPDGRTLASGGEDGTVRLWNVATGESLATLTLPTPAAIQGLAFPRDGKTLVTGAQHGEVVLWDTGTLQQLGTLQVLPTFPATVGRRPFLWSVAISPDATQLATATNDRVTQLWDLKTLREQRRFTNNIPDYYDVAFAPDGKSLATTADGRATVWDVTTGAKAKSYDNLIGPRSIAFSSDGNTLIVGELGGRVSIWNLATGERRSLEASFRPRSGWYLPAIAFVIWCIAWYYVRAQKFSVAPLLQGLATAAPAIVLPYCAVTRLSPGPASLIWSLWAIALAGLASAAIRAHRSGASELFLGEWLWALKGILAAAFVGAFDIAHGALSVAFFSVDGLLVLGLLALPWKGSSWRRHAPWQHWACLTFCVLHAAALLAAFWFA